MQKRKLRLSILADSESFWMIKVYIYIYLYIYQCIYIQHILYLFWTFSESNRLQSLFLRSILCGQQHDQGFFQFVLKTVAPLCILCHPLKCCVVRCLLLCSCCSTVFPFPGVSFLSQTAASFPLVHYKALFSVALQFYWLRDSQSNCF